jgi:site-specific DNA recombinase
MKKVAIYVRVSTLEQAESGYSVQEQLAKLKAYCEARDWSVFDEYVDGGFSGSNLNRPAMDRLIADAKSKKFDLVLVYKLDRLSRSQKDTLFLIEDVFSASGVDFVSVNENFDTSSPFGKAMIGILSVFAQLEREQIRERMMLGRVGRAKSGKSSAWLIQPFGYSYDQESGLLVVNPVEAPIVQSMFADYLAGTSINHLRIQMNADGHLGKPKPWSHRAIAYVLRNPVYAGDSKYGDQLYPGGHEPLVSRETFDAVQLQLTKRQLTAESLVGGARPFQAKYLLSGLLYCGYCGSRLTVMQRKKRKDGTSFRFYQCLNRYAKGDARCPVSVSYPKHELEATVLAEVARLQSSPSVVDEMLDRSETPTVDVAALKKEQAAVQAKLRKLTDLYLADLISMDEMRDRSQSLQAQVALLASQIDAASSSDQTAALSPVLDLLSGASILSLPEAKQKAALGQLLTRIDVERDSLSFNWSFSDAS